MTKGETKKFGQYEIRVSDIVFVNDLKILKTPKNKQRPLMTKENIQIHKNYANISILKDSQVLTQKKAKMLSPLRYKSFQATISEFLVMEDGNTLGVNLTLTNNVLNLLFFIIYGLMILVFAGFTAITWKKPQYPQGSKKTGELFLPNGKKRIYKDFDHP